MGIPHHSSRSRKPVGGLEPRGELSIDVRRLLKVYLDMPTVGGRLLPLLNSRAPDVRRGFQGEDERGTPRRDAGKCGVAHQMNGSLLGLFLIGPSVCATSMSRW